MIETPHLTALTYHIYIISARSKPFKLYKTQITTTNVLYHAKVFLAMRKEDGEE